MLSEVGEEVEDCFSDWSNMLCLVQWEEEDEHHGVQPGVC